MTNQLAVYELDSLYDGKYAIEIKVFPYADGTAECELSFDNVYAFTVEIGNTTNVVESLQAYFYDVVQTVHAHQQEEFDAAGGWNQ